MSEWFTAMEIAKLPDAPSTPEGVRYRAQKEFWKCRARSGQGGGKEYHISSLPVATQVALYKKMGKVKIGDQIFDLPKAETESVGYCRESLWASWNKTNDKGREKATLKVQMIQAVNGLVRNGIKKVEACDAIAKEYGTSASSVRRAIAKVKGIDECDWAAAQVPKYQETAEKERTNRLAEIDDEAWEFFKGIYLRLEEPSFASCYERLKEAAKHNGWEIPSKRSLYRRKDLEIPKQQEVLLRKGEHALHQMFPPQERSVQGLHALEWINGDGYQHNVFVRWFNDEIIRPKTWFWQDVYSRKILAWRCDISENTDAIRLSFMDVCETYGIPKSVTQDNTTAAANKWMTGGVPNRYRFKVKEDDPKGIITMLVGPENVHWTSVNYGKGHGQAKPVERAFGIGGMEEYIDKDPRCQGAYTGPNPMAKPDNYGSKAIDAEVFLEVIAKGVELWNAKENRNTEICRGFMSFNQAFNASYEQAPIRKATSQQLHMMMLQAEAVTVSKHGTIELKAGGSLRNRKNRYFNELMMNHIGKKLVARFDPQKLHAGVEIYALNGVHICSAECLEKVGFGDTQAAREHSRKRKQFTKLNKQAAKAKVEMTALEAAALMKPVEEDVIPETKVVQPIRSPIIGNAAVNLDQDREEDENLSELEQNLERNLRLLRQKRGDRL